MLRTLFTFALVVTASSATAELPAEFTASYDASTYGIRAARATYELKHENDNIVMRQHSEPVGFAAFLVDDTVDEHSVLSYRDGLLLVDSYSYRQHDSDKDRDVQVRIEWRTDGGGFTGLSTGTARGKAIEHEVRAPVWDTLSFQIALMREDLEELDAWHYDILVRGKPRRYDFTNHGKEKIDIGGRSIEAYRVERSGDRNKQMIIWLSPELDNLPVKILNRKDGKTKLELTLTDARISGDKVRHFDIDEETDF